MSGTDVIVMVLQEESSGSLKVALLLDQQVLIPVTTLTSDTWVFVVELRTSYRSQDRWVVISLIQSRKNTTTEQWNCLRRSSDTFYSVMQLLLTATATLLTMTVYLTR